MPSETTLIPDPMPSTAETCMPRLRLILQATVTRVVAIVMSTSYILGFSSVIFSLKSRFCKENAWQVRATARDARS